MSHESKIAVEDMTKLQLYRYIIFVVNEDMQIDVEVIGARDEEYDQFLVDLEAGGAGNCRFALYDFKDVHQCEGRSDAATQLVLLLWCPDTAHIVKKMIYASSFGALKKALVGVHKYIQATDLSEVCQEAMEEKLRSTDRL